MASWEGESNQEGKLQPTGWKIDVVVFQVGSLDRKSWEEEMQNDKISWRYHANLHPRIIPQLTVLQGGGISS